MTIPRDQFEIYEHLILSGQIEQRDAPALLADDLQFASWYLARAQERRAPR